MAFIILDGNPSKGYRLIGPIAKLPADGGAYELGFSDSWEFELELPRAPATRSELTEPYGYDPNGTAVVFGGCISVPWLIYGPFKDIEAAQQWAIAEDLGVDCAIELTPVPSQKKVA